MYTRLVLDHAAGARLQQAQRSVDSLLSLIFASLSQVPYLTCPRLGGCNTICKLHKPCTIRQKKATLTVKQQFQFRVANVYWFVERLMSEEQTEFHF